MHLMTYSQHHLTLSISKAVGEDMRKKMRGGGVSQGRKSSASPNFPPQHHLTLNFSDPFNVVRYAGGKLKLKSFYFFLEMWGRGPKSRYCSVRSLLGMEHYQLLEVRPLSSL